MTIFLTDFFRHGGQPLGDHAGFLINAKFGEGRWSTDLGFLLGTASAATFTAKDNGVIEEIMAVILQHGLSADQATMLLGRTIQLLEWGKQAAHEMPEANA